MSAKTRFTGSLLAGLLVTGAASQAEAAGFSTARFGGEHGNPLANNPTTLYYNPAGIAESEGYHIFVDGNIALRGVNYTHSQAPSDPDEPAGAEGANFGEASLFNVAAAPMIGATGKWGDFAAGLAFYVPFGGSSSWSKNPKFEGQNSEFPGVEDGTQRWASIDGTLRSLYWTLGLAYNIKSIGLSLGASANLIRSEIQTIRARNPDGSSNIPSEGRSQIDVGDWQGSFAVGALYQPIKDKLWFGLSYQARPNIAGGSSLDGVLINNFRAKISEAKIDVTQDLPDIYRFGAKWRPSTDIELRLFGDFTRWSAFEDQCLSNEGEECKVEADGSGNALQNVRRDWQDTFGVRLGGSYWVGEDVELFSGLGYDGNAVPDETLEPALVDFHDVSVALGGRLQIIENLAAALSYTHFFYIPRDTTGKSTTGPCEGGVAADNCLLNPSTSPDTGGKYSSVVGVINVNVDVSF